MAAALRVASSCTAPFTIDEDLDEFEGQVGLMRERIVDLYRRPVQILPDSAIAAGH